MENLNLKDIEYIDIITEDLSSFYINHNNIVDFSLIPKVVEVEEPEELRGFKYKVAEEGLIVVDNLKNIENEEYNKEFSEKEQIIQLRIKYKGKELENYYVTYQGKGSQLIALNEKGNVFITIQEPTGGDME